MAQIKYKVTLTAAEREELQTLVSRGKCDARKLQRARVLLLADDGSLGPGKTDREIVEALGCGERTVSRIRERFVCEGVEAAISTRPQPPRPEKVKISGAVEKQLVQLACSAPPAGRGCWTLQLLADRLVVLGLVGEGVSRETVRQSLKKTAFSRGW